MLSVGRPAQSRSGGVPITRAMRENAFHGERLCVLLRRHCRNNEQQRNKCRQTANIKDASNGFPPAATVDEHEWVGPVPEIQCKRAIALPEQPLRTQE